MHVHVFARVSPIHHQWNFDDGADGTIVPSVAPLSNNEAVMRHI
jgi:hypothetical protein